MDGVHPGAILDLQPSCQYAKKKALCIGINYLGNKYHELKGCINDAKNMRRFLCGAWCNIYLPILLPYDPFGTPVHRVSVPQFLLRSPTRIIYIIHADNLLTTHV